MLITLLIEPKHKPLTINMNSSIIEITVDLYNLTSSLIEARTFYTIFLDIADKQAQLLQKKCASVPGNIRINESLVVRTTIDDLQQSKRQARLTVYSIHNYGRKRLFGTVSFKVPLRSISELKMELFNCDDSSASLEFSCRSTHIESRVLSRNGSRSSYRKNNLSGDVEDLGELSVMSRKVSNSARGSGNRIFTQRNRSAKNSTIIVNQDILGNSPKKTDSCELSRKRLDEELSAKMSVELSPRLRPQVELDLPSIQLETDQPFEDLRATIFQLPYRATGIKQNDATISISRNLELMENYSTLLGQKDRPIKEALPGINSAVTTKARNSKDQLGQQLLKLTQDLVKVHQQEDLLNNDQKILEMLEVSEKENKRRQKSIRSFRDFEFSQHFLEQQQKRLQIESHTHDFIYFDSKRAPILRVRQNGDHDSLIYRKRSMRLMEESKDYQFDKLTKRAEVESEGPKGLSKDPSKKGVALIKPRKRLQSAESFQEWENDDNLKNIVHCMIDDVKGNLGYIKLSKLTHLRNQIKQIKDRNKHLIHANQCLVQTERFLSKKLELAEQVLVQKQKILAVDFQRLREKFKEVTNKLVSKYTEQIERENKIVRLKEELKKYDEHVKNLEQKLELRNKQVQHYKHLLVVDSNNQRQEKQEEMSIDLDLHNSRDKKFQRTSSATKLFRHKSSGSTKAPQKEKEEAAAKKEEQILRGINPTFKEFFLSFVNKNEEVSCKAVPTSSRRHLRRGLAQMAECVKEEESPQVEPDASSMRNTSMFLQI